MSDTATTPILASACLLGREVRYDGEGSPVGDDRLARWARQGRVVTVCPEVSGGLGVPRVPAEVVGGDGADVLDGTARVVTEAGEDVTDAFLQGAYHALEVARGYGVQVAVLKSKSPSCGCDAIYDGTFSCTKRDGMGVTAALLRREGIEVFDETQLDEVARWIG